MAPEITEPWLRLAIVELVRWLFLAAGARIGAKARHDDFEEGEAGRKPARLA
jgi:hypothetical protein